MNLTKEEIIAIADRLDDIIGDHFHDAIYDVYLQRENAYLDEDYSDEDVRKIKEELKRTL
jgi:hypothetical protein|tara:strand:+ start:297 stop:476 length:180 start_codon:yes stop_codon:yes gene_type:complete